jgi:urease gamma subunit
MIRVKATFKGEPDVPAFTRIFDSDDEIFFSSASMIEEKIRWNMKINANEALVTYCSYVVKSVRAGKQDGEIKRGAAKVLSADSVMIGVPETLQEITFEMIDGKVARKIVIKHTIPASGYIMAER